MLWKVLLLLNNLIVAVISTSINYCDARMCADANSHTFCRFRDGPSPACVGYIESPLTKEDKAHLIARLNRRRSEVAKGQLRGLPPAGNMLKLRWVEELAREAQLWADQCRIPKIPEERDICRDLYSTTVGQCVASVIGEAPGLRVESMIDMWYMQNIYYKGNVTSYKPPSSDSSFYGDFGQILWANTYMVGCGRSRFMAQPQGRLRSVERLVCNFAPRGPPASRALWSLAPPASACSSRSEPDRVLTALCSYRPELDETHDLDNSMTLEEHITLNAILEMETNKRLNKQKSLDELYLTKLAVITMDNIDTTKSYYNSIQKRDIAEFISLEDAKADLYKIGSDKNILRNMSAILNMIQDDSVTKGIDNFKKKVNFIGRPKSYDIGDMNDITGENKTQNVIEMLPKETMNSEKELLYAEYDIIEPKHENLTTLGDLESSLYELPANEATLKPTSAYLAEIGIHSANSIVTPALNESIEAYANDSETVRELQEALDRMEESLEPALRGIRGKVRRDLRQLPEEIKINDSTIPTSDSSSDSHEEFERNKTIERGPMLSMVLRYMPYLKQYENEILGNVATECKMTVSSFYLIIVLCF